MENTENHRKDMKKTVQRLAFIFLVGVLITIVISHRLKYSEYHVLERESETLTSAVPETPATAIETEWTPLDHTLQEQLQIYCKQMQGTWDIWVESLSDHTVAHVQQNEREDQSMVSASLIKLFIMGAVYDSMECGQLSDEAIEQEIYSMITVSDNNAANNLIRKLGNGNADAGMERVNDFASKIGCTDSMLCRLMLVENGLQNYTSAADCAHILELIYSGQCVSKESSAKMLSVLIQQKVNNRIPAGIPDNVSVAHKTGDLSGICCADVGLVFAESGDYILCVICNDPPNDVRAATQIMELSEFVYHFYATSKQCEDT